MVGYHIRMPLQPLVPQCIPLLARHRVKPLVHFVARRDVLPIREERYSEGIRAIEVAVFYRHDLVIAILADAPLEREDGSFDIAGGNSSCRQESSGIDPNAAVELGRAGMRAQRSGLGNDRSQQIF